ncbi:MAG: hypothetical protein ACYDFT_06090, partial [Thermoplasmata archaeon]
ARIRYERRGLAEELLGARSGLARLFERLPKGRWEILEEKTGAEWVGTRYDHPLRAEMPSLGALAAPAGTILASEEVDEGGTGLVPLVPAHGPSDARLGQQFGLAARIIVDPHGMLAGEPTHKYSGLPLDSGEAFLERDLADDGRIFADYRERRGVPRCFGCGTELLWIPSQQWCLDLSEPGPALQERFARLLPGIALPKTVGTLPWPISTGEEP